MNQSQENPQTSPPSTAMRTAPFTPGAWLRPDMLILFIVFIVFYYFKLSTFSISIDDEFGAVRDSANVWLIQGRWGGYLLERLFVSEQVVPFFPFFVFGCCLSISYPILLSAFGVKRLQLIHYIAFPLYVAFPVWIFALSFFSNTIAFGLGQLLATCAVRYCRPLLLEAPGALLQRPVWPRTTAHMLRAAAFAAAAIGMYQTFAFSVAVLGLAIITIVSLDEGVQWRAAFGRGLILLLTLAVAVVLYEAVELAFLMLLKLGKERYVGNFLNLPALLHNPGAVLRLATLNIAGIYGGGARIFGVTAYAFPATVCCGIAALASWPGVSVGRRLLLLTAAGAMLTLPFILHVAAGGELPARTLVAVPAMMWFFGMLGMTSPRRWLAKLSFVTVAVAALQILYIINLLQTANEFARKHDEALAAAIYTRIVSVSPDVSSRAPLVDFYGAKLFESTYPRPIPATAGYSFFEWDGGNIYRIVTYMRLLGYTRLQIPTPEQRHLNDATFLDMPVWPSPDSVRVANGMTLVKLGPLPGFR
jgi:Glucosyl transferase GtrII